MAFSPNGSHKEKACKQFLRDEKSGTPLTGALATPLACALGTVPLFYLKSACGGSPTGGEQLALSWPGNGRVGPVNFLPVIFIIGCVSSGGWKVTDNISEFNEIVQFHAMVWTCIRNRRVAQRGGRVSRRALRLAAQSAASPSTERRLPSTFLVLGWFGPSLSCKER
jgi:hypothetical protein